MIISARINLTTDLIAQERDMEQYYTAILRLSHQASGKRRVFRGTNALCRETNKQKGFFLNFQQLRLAAHMSLLYLYIETPAQHIRAQGQKVILCMWISV